MAKWILLNEVLLGGSSPGIAALKHFPGETIDDTLVPTAPIVAGGGVLWPATDTVVAAAAATATVLRLRGQGQSAGLSSLLLAAAACSTLGGSGGPVLGQGGESSVGAGVIQKRTITLTPASFAGVAADTATLNIGAILPANARIISREVRIATELTGGGVASVTASVGVAGATTEIVNAQDVFGTSGNVPGTAGANPNPLYATASQLIVTITSTSANLDLLTAGSVTIDVMFTVLP